MSKAKTGRPRKLPLEKTTIALEVPDTLAAAYQAWTEELQVSVPGGAGITRADLMRDVLARALREREGEKATAAPSGSGRRKSKS